METGKESKSKPKEKNEIDAHRIIVLWLFVATISISSFLASSLIYSDKTGETTLTILPVVILAGVLGSFVSALNRIYSSTDIFPIGKYKELIKGTNLYLIAYSSIPPLVGAISACILYVIVASEIIKGPFFPEFSCENGDSCNTFQSFLSYWSPKEATDYAKTIVWGFVAGFSERFVPDILNRVATDSSSQTLGS